MYKAYNYFHLNTDEFTAVGIQSVMQTHSMGDLTFS